MNRLTGLTIGLIFTTLLAASTVLSSTARGEEPEKIWVFFEDKGITTDAEIQSALTGLEGSYDERAIRRRVLRRTVPGLFDEHDLPVYEAYVEVVLSTGAQISVRSRWLNAISVRATANQRHTIDAFPCVRATKAVRKGRLMPLPSSSAPQGRSGVDFYGLAQQQLEQINVRAMHAQGYTGAGVVIGVLDTGFRRDHAAFNESGHELNVIAEWDFVNDDPETGIEPGDAGNQHEHGTYIIGTMGAYKPDELVGGAYDASFILAKVEDVAAEYPLEEDWFTAGLEFIEANGGDVATSSLVANWYTQEAMDGETAIMTQAFNIATANGLHCCQGAGNSGNDLDPATSNLRVPADAFDVLTVGAVDVNGDIAAFSSDGPTQDGRVKPEVLTRGYGTWTVAPNSATLYSSVSGTSLATPLTAAAVACIVQAHPDWSVATMRQRLMETADYFLEFGTYDPLYVLGYGIIDALAASDAPTATPAGPGATSTAWSRAYPNPFRNVTTFSYSSPAACSARLALYNVQGRLVRSLVTGWRSAGRHSMDIAGEGLPPGLYLYRLDGGGSLLGTGRLLLLK